jgi:toxin ParE1/3/4
MDVRWTDGANADLVAIFEHVAEDNPAAARDLASSLRRAVQRLADFPASGRVVPEIDDPAVREVIVPPYRVIYTADVGVLILAVHHSRQQLGEVPAED